MKIGLVVPSIPGYSETFFRYKIRGLKQNGAEVILFVNQYHYGGSYEGCKVIRAPKLNGNKLLVFWNSFLQLLKAFFINPKKSYRLYKLNKNDKVSFSENLKSILANQFLLSNKIDWLHYGFGTMALGRENVARAIGARMAVSFRGFDIGIYAKKHPECYRLLYQKVDKVHVISEDIKNLLLQDGLSSEKDIVKITPAINTEFFKNDQIKKKENHILTFITIARLHWKKGLNLTIDALALLKKEDIPFHYTLIGDGEERERLLFAIHQLGLSDCVTLTGKLPHEEVRKQLQQSDIYIQYSIQEGFCNAVLEAQVTGLLCVVSDAEGLAENVQHNQTGWVVPKMQPCLLAETLKRVIQLPEAEQKAIRKRAVDRVCIHFNTEVQQRKFLDFYEIKNS